MWTITIRISHLNLSKFQQQTNTSYYGEFQSLSLGIAEQNGETIVTGQTNGKQQVA